VVDCVAVVGADRRFEDDAKIGPVLSPEGADHGFEDDAKVALVLRPEGLHLVVVEAAAKVPQQTVNVPPACWPGDRVNAFRFLLYV